MTIQYDASLAQGRASPAITVHPSDDAQVNENYKWITQIAYGLIKRRKLPPNVDASDLIQEGYFGLCEAQKRYDSQKGSSFKAYAGRRIEGAMLDYLRKSDVPRFVRRDITRIEHAKRALAHRGNYHPSIADVAKVTGLSSSRIDEILAQYNDGGRFVSLQSENGDVPDFIEQCCLSSGEQEAGYLETRIDTEESKELHTRVNHLPARERTAIILKFYKNKTHPEIGKELGVSGPRSCQLVSQGIRRLRQRMRKDW